MGGRSRKTKVAAGPSAEGPMPTIRSGLREAAKRLIPLAALAAAYFYCAHRMWTFAASQPECVVTGAVWKDERVERPSWMNPADLAAINEIGAAARGRPVFEAGLGQSLARRYADNPWVEKVEAVRCAFGRPPRLNVDLRLRAPFASVAGPDGAGAVVDRSGTALPMGTGDAARLSLPAIQVKSRVRLAAGEKLADRTATDALAALGMLQDHLAAASADGTVRIVGVKAESAGDRTRLSFATATDTRLEWGEFTDEPSWGEPGTRQKLELLDARIREIRDWSRIEQIRLDHKTAPMKLRAGEREGNARGPAPQPRGR